VSYLRGQLGELSESSKSFSEGVKRRMTSLSAQTNSKGALTITELQRVRDVQEDCLGDITGLKAINQRLDVGFEQLRRSCSVLKTAQTNGQKGSEAQISELRHKVEDAAKLSDEYYLAKMQEFSDNAICPVISMQRSELEELLGSIPNSGRRYLCWGRTYRAASRSP
jgi:hypothetical protein